MRAEYYQDAGNPVQRQLLPKTSPTLEFVPVPFPPAGFQERPIQYFLLLTSVLTGAYFFYLCLPPKPWLEPLDLLVSLPIVAYGINRSIKTRSLIPLLEWFTLAALVVLIANHRVPWEAKTLVFGLMLGLHTYLFGQQWMLLCTASPVPRQQAKDLRATWGRQLMAASLIAIALAFVAVVVGQIPFLIAVSTLILTALFMSNPAELRQRQWNVRTVYWRSVSCWLLHRSRNVPGLQQVTVSDPSMRMALTTATSMLFVIAIGVGSESLLHQIVSFSLNFSESLVDHVKRQNGGPHQYVLHLAVVLPATLIIVVMLPLLLTIACSVALTAPVLVAATVAWERSQRDSSHSTILEDVRNSTDLIERDSIYLGRVAADGSPVLVPRKVFAEHAHGLGDSGSGKTSLFLCPLIEQLVTGQDCSVIVLDLKADSLELLATLRAAGEQAKRQSGREIPLRYFSNQTNRSTFAFNPMTQPYWSGFDLLTRTDILCGANGLTYGTDYGQGYYSSANAAILFHSLKTFPHVETFTELADCIGDVITTAKRRELNPEIRKAGVHVHEVIKRLAACQPLNVTRQSAVSPEVSDRAIDLTEVFQTPQLIYFHLSSTLSPSGAPEIARLVNYMLLAASTQCRRKIPVYLVVDEFQRMVASNLEYMLQLARSMDVRVILANQSMQDLKKSTTNLIPAVEANCRVRQWFSVSSSDDQLRLSRTSGTTVDFRSAYSYLPNDLIDELKSYMVSEQVVERIGINDILLASDHPFRSILRISRGDGYSQYGGMPVIIESRFHISKDEYERRRAMPWPESPGSFVPINTLPVRPRAGSPGRRAPVKSPNEPDWSEEIIDASQSKTLTHEEKRAVEDLFQKFKTDQTDGPDKPKPKRRRKR